MGVLFDGTRAGYRTETLVTPTDRSTPRPGPADAIDRPLLLLLERDTTPSWATHTVATVADNHTRPIVVLDEQHGRIDVFATGGQSGGDVYRKTSPMATIAFPAGRG